MLTLAQDSWYDTRPEVLVMSHDAARREALAGALRSGNVRVVTPPHTSAALTRTRHVQLVIFDGVDAPPRSWDFCREVRSRHGRLGIVVIGKAGEATALNIASEVGAVGLLNEPVPADALLTWVQAKLSDLGAADQVESEAERFRAVVESSHAGAFVIEDLGFCYVNPRFCELFGYTPAEFRLLTLPDLIVQEQQHSLATSFLRWVENGQATFHFSFRGKRKDGHARDIDLHCSRVEVGGKRLVMGTTIDIGRRVKAQGHLRDREDYFRALIEGALDIITLVDREGTILYESPSVEANLGYPAAEVVGQNIFQLMHRDDVKAGRAAMERLNASPTGIVTITIRLRNAQGVWRTFEATARDLTERDPVRAIVINSRDITEQKEAEDALRRAAFHDALTGLPNRALFADRLAQASARLAREPDGHFAILYLDLDRFKVVNDSLGHAVGDELLISVAKRLQLQVRPSDTVARFGGDEFAILLEHASGPADCVRLAERILKALSVPYTFSNGHEVVTSASIGIVIGTRDDNEGDRLLRSADMAMYRAKERGGAYEVFDLDMHAAALARLEMETDLRRAISSDQLRVQYQPIMELNSGEVAGFEALVRWAHPTRGMIGPVDFIGIAEETGHIVPIGRWMIERACEQMMAWREMDVGRDFFVAVNLSARQLRDPDLVADVRRALERTRTPAKLLKLEITESMVVENTDGAIQALAQLKQLGIQLFMDDFGTGFASLSYLHRLPLDGIKIDRSFVGEMHRDGRHAHLVASMVDLAHGLGLTVVAEGIELSMQQDLLTDLGCDFGQGYLFARPLDAEAGGLFLRSYQIPRAG